MRTITDIIIHCSDTPDGRPNTAEDIDRWHKEKGWNGIGYHWVIGVNGELWPGRPEEKIGAHVKGHNSHSIGICLIGRSSYSLSQWHALYVLVKGLTKKYPGATVKGHRDYTTKKTCPNFDVTKWWEAVRD